MAFDFDGALDRLFDGKAVDDPAARVHAYEQLRRRLEASQALAPAQKAHALQELEAAISRHEARHELVHRQAHPAAADAAPEPSADIWADDPPVERPRRSWKAPAIALGSLVVLGGLAALGYVYLVKPTTIFVFDASAGTDNVVFENFLKDASTPEPNFQVLNEDGRTFVRLWGQSQMMAAERIPVDPTATYAMTVRFRVAKDDPKTRKASRFYAGVATYDAEGNLETEPPGAHRYFVSDGQFFEQENGWKRLTGYISGRGNESHSMFRQSSETFVPIILANYRSKIATSDIARIEVRRCGKIWYAPLLQRIYRFC
ncbi:MAG: hypothetical protein AB7L41_06955 [Flavobacteriaceae bacterium]